MFGCMKRSRLAIALVALLAMSTFVHADENLSVGQMAKQTRSRVKNFARGNNLQTTDHRGLLYLSMKTNSRTVGGQYVQACGPNVVEFFKAPLDGHRYHHLLTRVEDSTFSRIWNLSQSRWYPSNSSKRVGVLVQLNDAEMRNFRTFLVENRNNPTNPNNSHGTIGNFNVAGSSHCTNYLTHSKNIGARGESLPKLLTGYNSTGIAPTWINRLIKDGLSGRNDRIVGVTVHGNHQGSLTDLKPYW